MSIIKKDPHSERIRYAGSFILDFVDIAVAHGALPFALEKDHFSFLQGFLHVDDILIGRASEEKGGVLQLLLERAVHENVNIFKERKTGFGISDLASQ